MTTLELMTTSLEQTQHLGYCLGQLLHAGDVICLSGELGAGKTALSGGIGRGWGAVQSLPSPTFVIVHQHARPQDQQVLHHIDAYRIQGDADSIGLEDIFERSGAVLIEWAEHVRDELPSDYLWISLDYAELENARYMTFTAHGNRPQKLLAALQANLAEEN